VLQRQKITTVPVERVISTTLFSIHSIPSFWLASLSHYFFLASYRVLCQSSLLIGLGLFDQSPRIPLFLIRGLGFIHFSQLLSFVLSYLRHCLYQPNKSRRSDYMKLSSDYISNSKSERLWARKNKSYWKHGIKKCTSLITRLETVFPALNFGLICPSRYIFANPSEWGKLYTCTRILSPYEITLSSL